MNHIDSSINYCISKRDVLILSPDLPSGIVLLFFFAGVAQLVERQPSKLRVASSSLVSRSYFLVTKGRCSSGVECFLGKEEVTGSIPVIGS